MICLMINRNILMLSPVILLGVFFIFTLNFYFGAIAIPGFSLYDIKRLFQFGLLLLTGLSVVSIHVLRVNWINTWLGFSKITRWSVVAFFLVGLISTAFSELPAQALLEVVWFALLFVFAMTIASQVDSSWLFVSLFVGIAVYASTTMTIALIASFVNHPIPIAPGFVNLRFLSQYQIWTMGMIVMPLVVLLGKGFWWRLPWYLLSVVWWLIAIQSASKGMWLGVIVASIFVALLTIQQVKEKTLTKDTMSWIVNHLICFALAATAFLFWQLLTTHNVLEKSLTTLHQSTGSRVAMWRLALDYFKQSPLLGIGPMHYAFNRNGIASHPHNSLLQILSEWGLFAFGIFVFLYVRGTYCWFRSKINSPVQLGLTFSFVAASVYAFFTGMFVMPMAQTMTALFLGWMINSYYMKEKVHNKVERHQQIIFVVLIVALIILSCILIFPELKDLPHREIMWLHQNNTRDFQPRFWVQGWLQW